VYIGIHVKYQQFLSDFNKTYVFLTDFQYIIQYKISQKSITKLFNCEVTDRRTDVTKLTVGFRNSANALKNPIKIFGKLGPSIRFVTQNFNGTRVALKAFQCNNHH
jgi:hypothetical protein